MSDAALPRSIHGRRRKSATVTPFRPRRAKTRADLEARITLAQGRLMVQGYNAEEAKLIVDDFLDGGGFGMWNAQLASIIVEG